MKKEDWFCEECHIPMDDKGDFFKCPTCEAEVWAEGEGSYSKEQQAADLAEKVHGQWFCQRCRVPMETVTGDFAKCPTCGAEVWFGKTPQEVKEITGEDIETLMQDFARNHQDEPYAAMIGGRAARGGGGSKNGKGKDKRIAMKKPTCEALYQRLCNS